VSVAGIIVPSCSISIRIVLSPVAGAMFLSGGQSELEATLNLNAMNQSANPWHVSFSYARALQNSCLKTWQGERCQDCFQLIPSWQCLTPCPVPHVVQCIFGTRKCMVRDRWIC
jgi:Fructose-bisphosphate aldolase class-I